MPNWELNDKDIITFLNAKAESYASIIEGSFMSKILQKTGSIDATDNYYKFINYSSLHPEFLKMFFPRIPTIGH